MEICGVYAKVSQNIPEAAARMAIFEWCQNLRLRYGDAIPRTELAKGVPLAGAIVHVIGPQGIFKPKGFELPLSITTSPDSPYGDTFSDDGYLLYKYRGIDPSHPDNVGLRSAGVRGVPLVYFHGLIPGKYMATWPVFIRGDNPGVLQFSVSVDDRVLTGAQLESDPETPIRRRYATSLVRHRIHQRAFRERVVAAYLSQCAMCRLRHDDLLDAAHIVADSDEGDPKVSNGLALCKLHHAAFDSFLISVTPDYDIRVQATILEEHDGPMLEHGLKGLHGLVIQLPKRTNHWPDRDSLAQHLERFRSAA